MMKQVCIISLCMALFSFAAAANPTRGPASPASRELPALPQDSQPRLLGSTPGDFRQKEEKADALIIYNEWLLSSGSMEQANREQKQLEAFGLRVKNRSWLPRLGFVLTTYQLPVNARSARLREEVSRKHPQLEIEFNQRYLLLAANEQDTLRHFGYALSGVPPTGCASYKGTVALMDAAVHPVLPGLAERLEQQPVFNAEELEVSDHGSAIAALLGSLLPNAHLLSLVVYQQDDAGKLETRSDWLMAGFEKALAHDPQPDVLNMSFGGNPGPLLERAINRLHQQGIRLVAAAGNGGSKAKPVFPAAYPAVRAVAAVDLRERVWSGSNRGEYIAYAAPGVDVWLPRANGEYAFVSGTSYAAPWVSAAAALASNEQWGKPATLARDLGKIGRDSDFGYGLVQFGNLCH